MWSWMRLRTPIKYIIATGVQSAGFYRKIGFESNAQNDFWFTVLAPDEEEAAIGEAVMGDAYRKPKKRQKTRRL